MQKQTSCTDGDGKMILMSSLIYNLKSLDPPRCMSLVWYAIWYILASLQHIVHESGHSVLITYIISAWSVQFWRNYLPFTIRGYELYRNNMFILYLAEHHSQEQNFNWLLLKIVFLLVAVYQFLVFAFLELCLYTKLQLVSTHTSFLSVISTNR